MIWDIRGNSSLRFNTKASYRAVVARRASKAATRATMARRERVSVIGPVMCQLRKMMQRSRVDQVKSIWGGGG